MAFTRKSLAGLGLNEEMIEKVMTLHGTSMADFIPKSELKAKIDEAVAEAQKNAPAPNIKDSDDYKALQNDFNNYKKKVENSRELKAAGVKDKYLDMIYGVLDPEKTIAEQIDAIREQYEESFEQALTGVTQKSPQFGAKLDRVPPAAEKTEADRVREAFESGLTPQGLKIKKGE